MKKNKTKKIVKYTTITVLVLLLFVLFVWLNLDISINVPCEECAENLMDFAECKPICENTLKEMEGEYILGKKINKLVYYGKHKTNFYHLNGEPTETIHCACKFK